MGEPMFECPYCREIIKEGAIKCPQCYTVLDRVAYLRQSLGGFGRWLADRLDWSSRQKDKKFLGVCSNIAARTGMPPLLVRLLFVVLTITGGHGFLVYILLFLLLPDYPGREAEKPRE